MGWPFSAQGAPPPPPCRTKPRGKRRTISPRTGPSKKFQASLVGFPDAGKCAPFPPAQPAAAGWLLSLRCPASLLQRPPSGELLEPEAVPFHLEDALLAQLGQHCGHGAALHAEGVRHSGRSRQSLTGGPLRPAAAGWLLSLRCPVSLLQRPPSGGAA